MDVNGAHLKIRQIPKLYSTSSVTQEAKIFTRPASVDQHTLNGILQEHSRSSCLDSTFQAWIAVESIPPTYDLQGSKQGGLLHYYTTVTEKLHGPMQLFVHHDICTTSQPCPQLSEEQSTRA